MTTYINVYFSLDFYCKTFLLLLLMSVCFVATILCFKKNVEKNKTYLLIKSYFALVKSDMEPPLLTCPDDINKLASGEHAYVSWPLTATDDDYANLAISCSPGWNMTFPIGQTLVQCQAQDHSDNIGTCSFTVLIIAGKFYTCFKLHQ